jgi:hypothetical protein
VGVYVGASLQVVLLPLMRFRPTRILCGLHACFLLQMAVLGGHLLPHPAAVRTLSGQLFIAGAFYFLWNNFRSQWTFLQGDRSPRPYLLGVLAVVLLLALVVRSPFPLAAPVIELLALLGLCAIVLAAALTLRDLVRRRAPEDSVDELRP